MTLARISNFLAFHWRIATIRWLYVFAVLFAVVLAILVGVVGVVAADAIQHDANSALQWQIKYYDDIPDAVLAVAIANRIEHERRHTNYYGLFDRQGAYLAGDLAQLPPGVPEAPQGVTRQRLLLQGGHYSPVVQVMASQRPDGSRLVIARDMTSVILIRRIVVRTLSIGVLIAIVLVATGTLILGSRQIRRVREMWRVTQCIVHGDLGQRLPVAHARDELDMLAHLVNHMLDELEHLMGEVKGACDGIAHDLRTPLVHLHAQLGHLAEREAIGADPVGAAILERARTETEHLLERFKAMLRVSEISALRRRGGFATVDLAELVAELADLYEPLAESRGLSWHVTIEAMPPVHVDRDLLFEAFSNLIDNAIKFVAPAGTVMLSLRSTLSGGVFEVSDNGPGIPAEERRAVLQRFYRGEAARLLPGSGLGLSLVMAVLRLHDFTLQICDAAPSESTGVRMRVECWPHTLVDGAAA